MTHTLPRARQVKSLETVGLDEDGLQQFDDWISRYEGIIQTDACPSHNSLQQNNNYLIHIYNSLFDWTSSYEGI